MAARGQLDLAWLALLDTRPADARAAVTSAGEPTRRAQDLTSDPVRWAVSAAPVRATLDGRPLAPEDPRGPVLVHSEEAGPAMWSLTLDLPPGVARVLRLDLTEPVLPGIPVLPEQPLSRPLARTVEAEVCR